MPDIASGVRSDLTFKAEVTQGTDPGGNYAIMRTTGRNINLEKNILQSAEVYQDRNRRHVRHGFNQVVGAPGFEMSLAGHDEFLAAALGGVFAAVPDVGTDNYAVSASGKTITRDAGNWISDGFRLGDIVIGTTFTDPANNVEMRILTLTATVMTVDTTTLVDQASGAPGKIDLQGERCEVGTTLTTFSMERRFNDITQYQAFRGVAVNTLDLNIQPEEIVGGSFGLIGMSAAAMSGSTVSGTATAASTNEPMNAFTGALWEGGALTTVATGLTLNVNNNRKLEPVVGAVSSPCVFDGTANITGTLSVFLEDAAMVNKFNNETATSIWMKVLDSAGTGFINIVLPNVKFTGNPIDPPSDQPIAVEMPFEALRSSVSLTSMSIQKSNV